MTTGDYHFVTDAVVTAVGRQLQAQGIGCGDTAAGQAAFPSSPSAAQLAALFALGFANWMRYGSDRSISPPATSCRQPPCSP